MSNQFAILINKPPRWNRANIGLLCEGTLSFLPAKNLPPRNVIFLEVVTQFRFIRVEINTNDVKSVISIGIVNFFKIQYISDAETVPNCPKIE